MAEEKKKIGRPKGSKDKFPRKLKSNKDKSVKDVKKKSAQSKKSNKNSKIENKKKAGRPPKSQEITIEEIKEALEYTIGHQGLAAEKLGISGATLTQRIQKNKELQEFRDNLRPRLFTWGMSLLQQHVKLGNLDALKFMLKGIGHDLNFYPNTTKQDVEISQKEGTTWRIERVVVKKK